MLAFFFARRRKLRMTSSERRFQALRWAADKFLLVGLVLAGLHVLAMMTFEDLSLREAVWLTMTTLMTVGYGDYAAKTPLGQASTVLLLYMCGVFIAAQAASAWFDYLSARREAMRNGTWDYSRLKDHVVVIAPGKLGELYLIRLLTEMEAHDALRGNEVILVTDEFPAGLPGAVANSHAKLVTGQAQDPEALERAAIGNAAYVLVIADDSDNRVSDGITYDVLIRVREKNRDAKVIAEAVDDRNRARLASAGANVVVRPIRAYPEMTVTSIVHPGSSEVIENLISASDDHIAVLTGSFRGAWKALVRDTLESGSGLPIAARLKSGDMITAPAPDTDIDASALYVLRNARGASS
jgi:voltage-gated potassium channel